LIVSVGCNSPFLIIFKAVANWSGHDESLLPQGIPWIMLATSSISWFSDSLETPTVFPAHPPVIFTL
jgi:hypothetical protein